MKVPPIILMALLSAAAALGQAQGGAQPQEYQVPVVEQVEKPDSPAADEAQGNAEAQLPAVAPTPDVEAPPAESPLDAEQPAMEP